MGNRIGARRTGALILLVDDTPMKFDIINDYLPSGIVQHKKHDVAVGRYVASKLYITRSNLHYSGE